MTTEELAAYMAAFPKDTPLYVQEGSCFHLIGTVYQDPEVNGIVLVPQISMRDS